jgi:hypothetical protein
LEARGDAQLVKDREWRSLKEALAWVKCRDAGAVAALAAVPDAKGRKFDELFGRLADAPGQAEMVVASDAWTILAPAVVAGRVKVSGQWVERQQCVFRDGDTKQLYWQVKPALHRGMVSDPTNLEGFELSEHDDLPHGSDVLIGRNIGLYLTEITINWPDLEREFPRLAKAFAEITASDPMQEHFWTEAMALAWIGSQSIELVQMMHQDCRGDLREHETAECFYQMTALWAYKHGADCDPEFQHKAAATLQDQIANGRLLNRATSPDLNFDRHDMRFLRSDVLKLWPIGEASRVIQTAKAETACREWLIAKMRASPDRRTATNADLYREAATKFPGLGMADQLKPSRKFIRALDQAINATGAVAWRAAGRPTRNRRT